jgi:D-xylose transport system permease protein
MARQTDNDASVEMTLPPGPTTPGRRNLGDLVGTINWRAYAMVMILLLIWIVFQYLTRGLFISSRNITNLLRQTSLDAILATGMVLVIVSGNIDLSAGSAVGLTAIIAGQAQVVFGLPTPAAVAIAILAGILLGAWQGFWTAYMNVPSFVVTLGGLLAFRGIGLVITNGLTLAPFNDSFVEIGQGFIPPLASVGIIIAAYVVYLVVVSRRAVRKPGEALRRFLTVPGSIALPVGLLIALIFFGWVFAKYFGMPLPVLIAGIIAVVVAFTARRTRFGRHLYAIGGNREASRLAGINISRDTFAVFVLMGVLYGIVGVLLAARLDAAAPNGGTFMELEAIAAAVIGGTSLNGGIGTVQGALVGALLMQSIANGMSLMNVQTFYEMIVTGLILILAVYLDVASRKRRA